MFHCLNKRGTKLSWRTMAFLQKMVWLGTVLHWKELITIDAFPHWLGCTSISWNWWWSNLPSTFFYWFLGTSTHLHGQCREGQMQLPVHHETRWYSSPCTEAIQVGHTMVQQMHCQSIPYTQKSDVYTQKRCPRSGKFGKLQMGQCQINSLMTIVLTGGAGQSIRIQ